MLGVLGLDPLARALDSAARQADGICGRSWTRWSSVALEQRQAARQRKDYAAADAIRDQLQEAGVIVEDTPRGPRWELRDERARRRPGHAAGPGGRTKSGKPRPGTGGYGKRKLEGKGPTPPAASSGQVTRLSAGRRRRPSGRSAARRTASRVRRPAPAAGPAAATRGTRAGSQARRGPRSRQPGERGAGSAAAELVAGRNPVLEALRARVPATALHVGPRLDDDERIGEAVMLAADLGIPVVEAGRSELDRITGGAIHQGLALRIAAYCVRRPRRSGRRRPATRRRSR